ncbi:MAG: hypothetical protein RR239_07885 [Oscillospiraceae bacterium]
MSKKVGFIKSISNAMVDFKEKREDKKRCAFAMQEMNDRKREMISHLGVTGVAGLKFSPLFLMSVELYENHLSIYHYEDTFEIERFSLNDIVSIENKDKTEMIEVIKRELNRGNGEDLFSYGIGFGAALFKEENMPRGIAPAICDEMLPKEEYLIITVKGESPQTERVIILEVYNKTECGSFLWDYDMLLEDMAAQETA